MRITGFQSFHADGGWWPFSFLKIMTDEGLSGWSEYALGPWAPALPQVIAALGQKIIGLDPRNHGRISAQIKALVRFAPAPFGPAQACAAMIGRDAPDGV